MHFLYYMNILNGILTQEKKQNNSLYHKTRICTTQLDKLITKC